MGRLVEFDPRRTYVEETPDGLITSVICPVSEERIRKIIEIEGIYILMQE